MSAARLSPRSERLAAQVDGALWTMQRLLRRLSRRLGIAGWVALALLFGCAGVALVDARMVRDQQMLRARLVQARSGVTVGAGAASTSRRDALAAAGDGRARLKAFDDHLLAHDDIPDVLEDVLQLAADAGLATDRGDYRAQADQAGEFLRYRMSLPVRGPAPAVHRFMQAALLAQPSLALESVQFKRDRIEAAEIEARIQWVIFARLPELPARPVATMPNESVAR